MTIRVMSAWFAVVLGVVGVVVNLGGCSGCDEPDAGEPTLDPIAERLVPATLPWPARTPTVGIPESGTVIGRRVHFEPTGGSVEWDEWEGALTATVALDDRVVVVFPPADREGFDLAVGGLDVPWERVPLNDIAPWHIGDLDATRDASGTVWIVMRKRTGDQAITLHRWRPGDSVTSEPIPRPFTPTSHWFHETCDDLAIGAAGSGHDIVFQQVDDSGGSQVMHVSRANETSPWQTKTVTTSATVLDTPAANRFFSVGCRSVLAHDDSGKPHVITLVQELHTQLLGGGPNTPLPMPSLSTYGFFLGADHVWLPARSAKLPDDRGLVAGPVIENWDDTDDTYLAQVDLDRHPREGFLWAGPILPAQPEALRTGYSLLPLSFTYDFAAVGHGRWSYETVQPQPFDWVRSGGKLEITECGIVKIHGEPVVVRERGHQPVGIYGAEPSCKLAPQAPVRAEPASAPRYSSWARGERPYDVAVCLAGEAADVITICEGAHELTPAEDGYYEVEDLPRIASLEPADGKLTASAPIVVRMNRPPTNEESWGYQLLRTFDGTRVKHQARFDEATGTLTITPNEPWLVGSQVRLAVWYSHARYRVQPWRYQDVPLPVAWFSVGDPPHRDDPRDVPPRLSCDAGGALARDTDGVCTFTETWRVEANGHAVPIIVPFDRARTGDPILRHPDGTVIPSVVGDIAGVYALRWTVPLEGNTRYEIVLPDNAKNLVGSWIHPDDRRIGVVTGAPIPALASSTPASGATGFDRTAPIELVFNTPVTLPTTAVSLTDGMTNIAISLAQLSTTTFQLIHAPLAARTLHTLTLSTAIVNAEGIPLPTTITLTFTTGD